MAVVATAVGRLPAEAVFPQHKKKKNFAWDPCQPSDFSPAVARLLTQAILPHDQNPTARDPA